MNPGIAKTGLFWTIMLPEDAVDVEPNFGGVEYRARNVHLFDFGSLANALGTPLGPATVSFRVRWSGATRGRREEVEPIRVVNAADGHAGEYLRKTAQMEWAATIGDYDYVSDSIGTSSSEFAEFGRERNGIFFSESED